MSTTLETEVVTAADSPLILTGPGYGLQIAPAYEAKKAELLKSAGLIARVNNPEDDAAAAEQIAKLAAMRIETEKSRKEVKDPALKFGLAVDEKAKSFSAAVVAEETRLKKARGEYAVEVQKERQRVLAEMEKQRQAEAERVRLAEAARVQAEREAEEARRKAEELAFNATTPEEDAEAARLAEEAAAADKERLRIAAEDAARVAALPVAAPAFVPAAPKGVKMIADFEVLNLDTLYHANPQLVTLSERRKEILEFIAAHSPAGVTDETLPTIPGLRVFLKPQVR
jgi:hypothetical protein